MYLQLLTSLSEVAANLFSEDERDFVRGLKFPTLDTSDSSEAEFALKPKSKSQKLLKRKPKTHPKDPAPSPHNDGLSSKAQNVENNKHKRSSSTSSYSESVISSTQNASDDTDLHNLDAFYFELEDRLEAEFPGERGPKNRKHSTNQEEVEKIEVCSTGHISANPAAFITSLDDSFEVLDK